MSDFNSSFLFLVIIKMYETNRQLACVIVGFISAIAWWLWIDGVWHNQSITHAVTFVGYETLVPISSTIAFLLLNSVNLRVIVGREFDDDESQKMSDGCRIIVRIWFYFWLSVLFTCCGAALWIWIQFYWGTWTGIAMFLCSIIFLLNAILLSLFRYYFRNVK